MLYKALGSPVQVCSTKKKLLQFLIKEVQQLDNYRSIFCQVSIKSGVKVLRFNYSMLDLVMISYLPTITLPTIWPSSPDWVTRPLICILCSNLKKPSS